MIGGHLGTRQIGLIVGLALVVLGPGLGGSGRLTYHEAIWAEAGREMLASHSLLVPTVGGQPWLEKPPLGTWMIALAGLLTGGVNEATARAPSAVTATLLAVAVASFAAGRFGAGIGLLAGAVQITTAWTVMRGRLAEADISLTCLVAWAILALDRMRLESRAPRFWRWTFFGLLGATSLAKGIGFGAVLVCTVAVIVLVWDRDREMLRRLSFLGGWLVAAVVALTWPVAVLIGHPAALGLWVLHISDRMAAQPEHFVGEPWWQYAPALLWQVLPWTPLALAGAWPSLIRAIRHRSAGDRLLWAWAVGPAALVSLASARNAHYLIYALPPWSVWSALALVRLGSLKFRGWTPGRLHKVAFAGFLALGLCYALGFAVFGPWFDRRGTEWAFYEAAGKAVHPDEPLVLLYDDWDRKPYPSPFGSVPHDLAVRLFYLKRPACWRQSAEDLADHPPALPDSDFSVIGRDRDVPALWQLGQVEAVARGPASRFDRAFVLFRVKRARNLARGTS